MSHKDTDTSQNNFVIDTDFSRYDNKIPLSLQERIKDRFSDLLCELRLRRIKSAHTTKLNSNPFWLVLAVVINKLIEQNLNDGQLRLPWFREDGIVGFNEPWYLRIPRGAYLVAGWLIARPGTLLRIFTDIGGVARRWMVGDQAPALEPNPVSIYQWFTYLIHHRDTLPIVRLIILSGATIYAANEVRMNFKFKRVEQLAMEDAIKEVETGISQNREYSSEKVQKIYLKAKEQAKNMLPKPKLQNQPLRPRRIQDRNAY